MLLVAAAVVLTVFTFGAAAGLIVLAVAAAAAIIAVAFVSAIIPDDLAGARIGAPIGRAPACYYQGQAFSEGAVLKVEDVRYECSADGKWVPVRPSETG